MMTPGDYIAEFAYDKYGWHALERGGETFTLEVSEIYDGLNGNCSRHFVCDVLGSRHFRNTYTYSWSQLKSQQTRSKRSG